MHLRKRKCALKGMIGVLLGMAMVLSLTTFAAAAERAAVPVYVNPKDIIITQPDKNSRVTSASQISIFGACDYDYPLYMNNARIPTTEHGFFTQYVELVEGENVFTFRNNGKEQTVVIMKVPAGKSSAAPKTVIYDSPMHGTVKQNYATHRMKSDDDPNLITPLAKGTAFKILGEVGSYYMIDGGTYIFKSSVDAVKGGLPENIIKSMYVEDNGDCIYVKYEMNVNTLYSIDWEGNTARLILRAARDDSIPDLSTASVMSVIKTVKAGASIYDFTFNEAPIGHFVEFQDGLMTVGFKRAAKNLTGAKIVLDAGHGDTDTGALGPPGKSGPVEKDFNLYVSLVAAEYLTSRGAEVQLIRQDDTFVPLAGRVSSILETKPDISVSVHVNSRPVERDFSGISGPFMYYTFDTGLGAASYIHQYITSYLGVEYRTPIKSNLALTRITNCPAILFEMSFMSNPDDYERLLNAATLDSIGKALGKGIEDYLREGIH